MKLRASIFLAFALAIAFAAVVGCGSKSADDGSASTDTPAASETPAAPASEVLAQSLYDTGPRAGDSPVDANAAAAGEKLFTSKGCTVCHHWGEKFTGPDLKGVTARRTALWMEHQILNPVEMVRTDPIANDLFKQYKLQMTNQGLTQDEAQQMVEYLKKRDKDGK